MSRLFASFILFCVTLVVLSASRATGADLVTNGSFEQCSRGFQQVGYCLSKLPWRRRGPEREFQAGRS